MNSTKQELRTESAELQGSCLKYSENSDNQKCNRTCNKADGFGFKLNKTVGNYKENIAENICKESDDDKHNALKITRKNFADKVNHICCLCVTEHITVIENCISAHKSAQRADCKMQNMLFCSLVILKTSFFAIKRVIV